MTTHPRNREMQDGTHPIFSVLGRPPGILIADDMGLILLLLEQELKRRGFAVWLAASGTEAVEMYHQHRGEIDLVLLDVQMPELDGPQTLTALQERDADVLACFMTGHPGFYTEGELLERGAACIFKKPFRMAEVVDEIQQMVSNPRSRLAAAPTPYIRDCRPPRKG